MKVCIDTTALALSGAGVRRVLAETTTALAEQQDSQPDISFWPFSPRRYTAGGHGRNIQPLRRAIRPPIERSVAAWARLGRPSVDSFLNGAQLYQVSEYIPYPVKSIRQIAIVHDLTAIRHPEWCATSGILWQRQRLEHIAEHAVHVIVPSEPTRDAWLTFSGWRPERVSTVPWGVDSFYRRRGVGEIEHVKDRLRLRNRYILHVGTIEPRKNLSFLLHAFERASRHFSQEVDLVLAGPRGWKTQLFDQAVEFTHVRDRVKRLGAVAEEFLPALISGAEALVLASHEEGFGLAALEALACGTPVITTQCATLPEDLHSFCVRIGGSDEEELAEALIDIVDDEEGARQAREEAAPSAQSYTWERTAGVLRRVYQSLL